METHEAENVLKKSILEQLSLAQIQAIELDGKLEELYKMLELLTERALVFEKEEKSTTKRDEEEKKLSEETTTLFELIEKISVKIRKTKLRMDSLLEIVSKYEQPEKN
jgi:hypothetical protein